MKKTISILLLAFLGCCNVIIAQTQNWAWAQGAGGLSEDKGISIATDDSGNVIATGWFQSPSITFGTTTLINTGITNLYIVKFDANGNVLWAQSAGGSNSDFGISVTTDALGNIYLTGAFSTSIAFGSTTLTNLSIPFNCEIFIVKYSSNGNVLWAKSAGGTNVDEVRSISTDLLGNVFITGDYRSPSITFGTITLSNPGTPNEDVFIVKYDTNGNVIWANGAGGSGYDFIVNSSTDINGNIIIAGSFYSPNITFGTMTLTNVGGTNIFVVKYDTDGNVIWAKSIGGPNSDRGKSLTTDANGNIFFTGIFSSPTITIDTTTLINAYPLGNYDLLTVKYDSAGNVLWAKKIGGNSLTTDPGGSMFLLNGFISPTLTIAGSTLINTGPTNTSDIYILKCDGNGNELWAKSAGGVLNDFGEFITTDANGNIYIVGEFRSPIIAFGPDSLTNVGPTNQGNIYIAKLDPTAVGLNEIKEHPAISIAPNPFTDQTTITFKVEQKNTTIKIMDILGKVISSAVFSGNQYLIEKGIMKPGVYFLQTIDEKKNSINEKLVVQ